MASKKKGSAPITSIRLFPEEKQLIRIAAAFLNKPYQTYMKEVVLRHALALIEGHGLTSVKIRRSKNRKVTFIDE
jgi:uncharacterized protein (DUF1778 family)